MPMLFRWKPVPRQWQFGWQVTECFHRLSQWFPTFFILRPIRKHYISVRPQPLPTSLIVEMCSSILKFRDLANFFRCCSQPHRHPTATQFGVATRRLGITGLSNARNKLLENSLSIKTSRLAASFWVISQLDSPFIFLRWFKLAHIYIQVIGLYKAEVFIHQQFF